MLNRIYADNAATTALDESAYEAMKPYLLSEYGNASQPYSFARQPKKAIQEARETIASCIGASPEEIYFTSGGTESDNWAIKALAFSDPDKRAMITSAFEHHAVLNSCAAIERLGYPVAYMWPTLDGIITTENLEGCISDNTRLVSVMFANNEIGSIQPVKDLCNVAHSHGALFHTDAVQAVGHIRIDVHELEIDLLSASAHKFNGPKGIGFLYVRNGVDLLPYMDGGSQEKGKRAGTENVAAIVAMAVALKRNCEEIETNTRRLAGYEDIVIGELEGLDFIRNGSKEHLPGFLSLSFRGKDGEAILHRMDLQGICISTGAACDSVHTQLSHVLKSIRLSEEYALGTVRITLGRNNTEEDAMLIGKTLRKIVGGKAK